jgi:peptidyl-prolyl cis-trans isomerase C
MVKLPGFWTGLAVAATLATAGMAQEPPTAATVVATVNGTEITLGAMIALRDGLPEQYKALPDDVLYKGILDQLVQQEVLTQSVGDALSLQDRLNVENQRRGYLSGVALEAVIATAVTDEALQKAYDARFAAAAPQTEYNAAHILVATEEEALKLKAELDGGADFAALAKEHSTDTGSGQNGGELGWFGLGAMVKPFEDAVVAAEVGTVTAPIKSDFGFHLILVKETRIAAVPTLDDLRDELAGQIEQEAISAHIEALTAAATVTKPGAEGIDPAVIKDLTLLGQ